MFVQNFIVPCNKMTVEQYIDNINKRYKLGNATEHTFRGDLQQLLETLVPDISATNEPKRIKCGAPDYVITKKEIPVGFIEAKDIGDKDLMGTNKNGNKEQFDRYKTSLNNLIFTDYLEFHLYIDGVFITKISIGEIQGNAIIPINGNFNEFTNLIKDFCTHVSQTIKSSKKLAEMMAGKARMLSDIIERSLTRDIEKEENSTLGDQMKAFKEILIHDIKPKEFADIYAQTIAYGMFAARLHDPTLPTFTRQEAAELMPKSNPFLRKLFGYIAGPDIDDRIKWIVDSLADIFRAADVAAILKNFGKDTQTQDPIIHFYETFLSEYDPKLRKARGVWYTPQPVVNFIVRAVDEILKTEFDLPQGLADTSKTTIQKNVNKYDERSKNKAIITGTIKQNIEVHKVQILDPATGTGTFLAEVLNQIHEKFKGQQGLWSNYVENHLLPRLNGFELLMASYAMAHLKLDLLLTQTGYKPTKDQRFKIYLTNSLEEHHQDTGTLFANWLSSEANEANQIKRDTPVMCIIGNPPYAISSTNKSEWIQNLIADYKIDLNERKINLDDDYIKFIRYGQFFIDKNGYGVLAYISNNSFLDGLTHRQMRKSLLGSFDKIYILDLHGNAKKKEVCADGSIDQNVFDIMQGVSINIFVKTGLKKSNELGKVFHSFIQGKRDFKYENLKANNINSLKFQKLEFTTPNYFFVPKNFDEIIDYEKGFKMDELFVKFSSGIHTGKDHLVIDINKSELVKRVNDVLNNEDEVYLRKKYDLEDTSGWTLQRFKSTQNEISNYVKLKFRVFDDRWIIYENKALKRDRNSLMKHFFKRKNIGLVSIRRSRSKDIWKYIFVSDLMTTEPTTITSLDNNYLFPLYLYSESELTNQASLDGAMERIPNLNNKIISHISDSLNLNFTNEKLKLEGTYAPIDLLDYIYSILHSQSYREKFKEFLQIDFPRIPYPKDQDTFWKLVRLGGELRQIHLLESPIVEKLITQYPIDGNNLVTKIKYENEKVYINESQYFDHVPSIAWSFYIGGYQPAQKWLKDRKDRVLGFEDILHYQKIIVALSETDRIMKEIDNINFL